MEISNLRKLEENYCWYLKQIEENDENLEYCEELSKTLENYLKEVELEINYPKEYYKLLKKSVIERSILMCLSFIGIASLFDLMNDEKLIETILYVFSVLKPAIMAPLMYKEEKNDFQNKFKTTKEELLRDKELLKYIKDINERKINKYIRYECLNEKEWKEFDELDKKFVFSKSK